MVFSCISTACLIDEQALSKMARGYPAEGSKNICMSFCGVCKIHSQCRRLQLARFHASLALSYKRAAGRTPSEQLLSLAACIFHFFCVNSYRLVKCPEEGQEDAQKAAPSKSMSPGCRHKW
jgi:hypothetical protein